MVRAISHLENSKTFRGCNCLYLADRLGQRTEVSAVTHALTSELIYVVCLLNVPLFILLLD